MFRETLNRVSNGTITENDQWLLSSRFYVIVYKGKSFDNATYIMAKNENIDKFNYSALESLNKGNIW